MTTGVSRKLGGGVLLALVAALLGFPAAAPADSRPVVERYGSSWIHRALGLQYDLGGDVALRNAPWVGTHNSFNSVAEMGPALSAFDSNQRLRLVEQLRIDVRSIELDLHWVPRPRVGGFAPVVCHGTEQHAGCTIEKELGPVLGEIRSWLRRPGQAGEVLLLYLEDHLDNQQGHDIAAEIVERRLGDFLYEPPGEGCTELPLDLTRDEIAADGARVIAVSGCGVGSGWPSVVFDWSDHEEARPRGYADFPDCGPDFTREQYDSELIRYFEDSTRLTRFAGEPDDGITPRTAARMARCGVDLTGLDQLLPFDGRLRNLVWSWAPGQPKAGSPGCAVQRVDSRWPFGRWFARSCETELPAACRDGEDWLVSEASVAADGAAAACAGSGGEHAVPRTGYEAQLLRLAMEEAGAPAVRLGYRHVAGSWAALDERD